MQHEQDLDTIRNLLLRSGLDSAAELRFLSFLLTLAHCLEWANEDKARRPQIFDDFLKIERKTVEFVGSVRKQMSSEDHLLLEALTGRRIFVLKEKFMDLLPAGVSSYPRSD